MAMNAVTRHGVSIALACRTFQISETCYRYSPVLSDENEEIADWLERLTANKRSWGFGLCFLYLRNVQGYGWNHKRPSRACKHALPGSGLPDLPRVGTELEDQAQEAPQARQT
jgi:putative transposase